MQSNFVGEFVIFPDFVIKNFRFKTYSQAYMSIFFKKSDVLAKYF